MDDDHPGRADARKRFTLRTTGGRRDRDFFCTASHPIRVGYPSAIQEIGIADTRLTRNRQAARRFFRSFD